MVCAYCGSAAHVTGYEGCPKYCTVCVASGHSRNTNACPNRICSKCHATGHMARQCTFCDTCQTNHAKNKCPNRQCAYCEEYGHENAKKRAKKARKRLRPAFDLAGLGDPVDPTTVTNDRLDECARSLKKKLRTDSSAGPLIGSLLSLLQDARCLDLP